MGVMAFTPMGPAVTFTAAASPPTPVQATSTTIGATQYRVYNSGSVPVFLGFGATSAAATTMATTSLAGSTIVLMPNAVEIFTLNANQYFTGATTTSTAAVYILSGDGL